MGAAAPPPLHLGLFGGPLDTGNLGVSALGISVVRGIQSVRRDTRLTLFDDGCGVRAQTLEAGDWSTSIELEGSSYSRRFYRGSNQQQAFLAARLGLGALHPFLRRLSALDAVLDISGGDSFSDLYGARNFRAITMPKRLALETSSLLLLPQTYGPFRDPARRALAADLMAGARQLWARDARSLEVAREMLGTRFDPGRHRAGVDVAFGLPSRAPRDPSEREEVEAALSGGLPIFGLNISGLLYNARDEGRSAFGLGFSYRDLVLEIATGLLSRHACRLLLISHVVPPCWRYEDDRMASLDLLQRLPAELRAHAFVVPALKDPMEVKWVVGHCNWLCGTRMHSCIAGLSQGIPTATVVYSDKSIGVFETVGAGGWVFDPRTDSAASILEGVLATVPQRREMAGHLRIALKRVEAVWHEQFRCIVDGIERAREVRAR
jgi:polysaccharide pyruvyl transferase WcaK-like protein